MKMKKWIALTASIGMALGTMGLAACGGGEAANIDYTITIVDQDGDAVQGVSFVVLNGEKTMATLETDENGVASGAMPVGEYTVSYTELPSIDYDVNPETAGVDIVTTFSISSTDADVVLEIPNFAAGTSFNPYTCYYETNEITDETTGEITYETSATMYVPTVKANSDNYYVVAKSGDRIICIEQADVTIIYKGVTYSAKDGAIEIQSQAAVAGDLNYWANLQIINDTDEDIELVMKFKETVTYVDYAITVKDQDGAIVSDVKFDVLSGEETVANLETDENGVARGTLPAGEYTVSYTQFPSEDYYEGEYEKAFILSEENGAVTLVIANGTEGSSLYPYYCYYMMDEETGDQLDEMFVPTVKADSSAYYGVVRAGGKIICIEQADVTVVYEGVTYSAKDGAIEIVSAGETEDTFYCAVMQIINETDADIELVMSLKDAPVEDGGETGDVLA